MATDRKAGRPKGADGETRGKVKALAAQDLSRNEIAAALGISSQAVHYHLVRIRKAQASKESAA